MRGKVLAACFWALSLVGVTAASAQTGGSAIVGTVKDETGAALPGVTVEAASPALIERVKTVMTSASGDYQIVALRPGTYTVTFTLPGFKVVKHEDIVLGTAFTATVNATLSVGGLEETLTVTGQSPLVDVRSGVSERALTQEVLEGVPIARNVYQVGLMMPGSTTTAPDVGGNQTAQITNLSIHGMTDNTWLADGIEIGGVEGDNVTATYYNEGFNQEMTVQTKALPAEVGGGVTVNMTKKEGSNAFKGDAHFSFTNQDLQSDNVTEKQRILGLQAPSATDVSYDVNAGVGGPIVRDLLWFYGSYRRWRVDRLTANTFNVDGTQALDEQFLENASGRLTYKINDANKLSAWMESLSKVRGHRRNTTSTYQFIAPEAAVIQPNYGLTASIRWTGTVTNRFMLEAGFASMRIRWGQHYRPDADPTGLSRNDLTFSTLTGAAPNELAKEIDWRRTTTASAMWLPSWKGSHQIRIGFVYGDGVLDDVRLGRGDLVARYRSGVPDSVQVFNTPIITFVRQYDHAAYAQDAWTIRERLTVNAGVRWQYFRGRILESTSPAGTFVPARTFAAIDNVPKWTNWAPRVAFAYDLFGTGKTAVKTNISKYMKRATAGSTVTPFNPFRLNSEIRSWSDANGDKIPQVSEIGPPQGQLTQGANVRIDPNLRRPFQWEFSTSLEHLLRQNLAVGVHYYRRKFNDLFTTANVALSSADYIAVNIANPLDGTPFTVYNQNPATRTRVDNVVTNSGLITSSYNGIEVTLEKRMSGRFMAFGGFTIGSNKACGGSGTNTTNPNLLINLCGYDSFDSKYMLNTAGMYRLPYNMNFSGHFQALSGKPLQTLYNVGTQQVPGLTQVTQQVAVLPRGARRKEAWTLLDLRLSRTFKFRRGGSVEPLIDLYNLLNENASLSEVETVGQTLGRVSSNVDGRIVRLGLKLAF